MQLHRKRRVGGNFFAEILLSNNISPTCPNFVRCNWDAFKVGFDPPPLPFRPVSRPSAHFHLFKHSLQGWNSVSVHENSYAPKNGRLDNEARNLEDEQTTHVHDIQSFANLRCDGRESECPSLHPILPIISLSSPSLASKRKWQKGLKQSRRYLPLFQGWDSPGEKNDSIQLELTRANKISKQAKYEIKATGGKRHPAFFSIENGSWMPQWDNVRQKFSKSPHSRCEVQYTLTWTSLSSLIPRVSRSGQISAPQLFSL